MANTDLINEGLLGAYHDELMKTHLVGGVVFDISAYKATGTPPTLAKFADLEAALGTNGANVPEPMRKGGMSVKFVHTSDNNYVQYRLMSDEWSTDTDDWAIAEEGVYVENLKFIYVKADSKGKLLWAVRTDGKIYYGAGVPPQIIDYINDEITTLQLKKVSDIVRFLGEFGESDTLAEMYVKKEEGKGLIDSEFADAQSVIENSEWMDVKTDSKNRILEGIRKDGTKVIRCNTEIDGDTSIQGELDTPVSNYSYSNNAEWLKVLIDSHNRLIAGIRRNGKAYFAAGIEGLDSSEIKALKTYIDEQCATLQGNIDNLQEEIYNITEESYDIADGNLTANGSYKSELGASCVANLPDDSFVKYHTASRKAKRDYSNLNIVVVNHDDLAKSDYAGTRKIYNKYDFNANFNLILNPFTSKADQNERVEEIKKLVSDGNDLGLHAILGKSYWWLNKMFDIRPDSTFTFAPTLANIQGNEADHTGVNDFGDTITLTKKVSEIGFANLPTSELANLVVVNMTTQNMIDVIRCYSIYGDYQYTISGLDLDGNVVSKTTLQWLEYWYNNLIDDTLGYSSTSSSIAEKFASDYTGTYPSKSEIKNGVITSNGVFTKGLFKGCRTCCNYEVTDRCIDVAVAFIRHYFDVDRFTNFGRHGVGFFTKAWKDSESGMSYDDSEKTILSNETFRLYSTRKDCWESQFDILFEKGIKMCNHTNPLTAILEGQVGLYFGQKGVRDAFFNHITYNSGAIDYWNFFGEDKAGSIAVSYADFETFLTDEDDWLKFAYENAGTSVTRNGKTFNVFDCIAHTINVIRACKDTGKIPFFSVDTIRTSPTIMTTIELISRYCYANGIRIVPVEEARAIVSSRRRDYSGNIFPNAGFNQSLYDLFKRDTTSLMAKIPDSWNVDSQSKLSSVNVSVDTVDDKQMRVLTLECSSANIVYTKLYGLPAGSYKLSFWAKSAGNDGLVKIFKKYNKDYILEYYDETRRFTPIDTKTLTSAWTQYETDIIIEEPYRNGYDKTDFQNVICQGYEDNVSNITIELYIRSDISIASPKLEIV